MTSEHEWHKVGDHRLVTVPTALTEVTFTLTSALTSASDSSTSKYFDNMATGAIQFSVVADQAIQVLGINGTDFTDAIPVTANSLYEEDTTYLYSIKIKTTTNNTQISVRVR